MRKKKSFFLRILNLKIFFRYINEALKTIKQGYRFKDKITLGIYFLRIPSIIIKSLITGKEFIELEEEHKFLSNDVSLKNENGSYYCGNNILTIYTISQYYERNLLPYFDIKEGGFIDVGAHIGKYSIKLGRNPNIKIIAIEPDRYNFSLLNQNIALNNLTNIIPINKGAYFKKDEITFYLTEPGEGMHSIFKQDHSSNSTTIEVDTLDNIVSELGFHDKINLIKIDVEGAEVEVLKGAQKIIKANHPNMIIEVLKENDKNISPILNILKTHNYSVKQLDENNYFFS